MIHRYAVMGYPVEHSLSPIIHQQFAQQTGRVLTYEKILIDLPRFEQQVTDFFAHGGRGLNITLPCKERAFAYAQHATARSLIAKAANTLWQDADGLHADNTDGVGLQRDLAHYIELTGKHILVLGAGGAARGILAPLLASKPAQLTIANRTLKKTQTLCLDFAPATFCSMTDLNGAFDLIINATSAGLEKQCIALPSTIIQTNTLCYDLAYQTKGLTPFLAWAQSHGCVAVNGLGMLVEQAAEAFTIWHGVMPDVAPVLAFIQNNR